MTDPTPAHRSRLITAVGIVGTAAGMLGIGHALYTSLARGPGVTVPGVGVLDLAALVEAGFLATFLELLVVACARRASHRAGRGERAVADIGIVLAAAVVSGVVSGAAAGWGHTGLFRGAVPVLACLFWLADVLARRRDAGGRRGALGLAWQRALVRAGLADHGQDQMVMDRERLLVRLIRAVPEHARLKAAEGESPNAWQRWRTCRADGRVGRLLARFEAAGGDRRVLAGRLNAWHHRADLAAPLADSPWTAMALEERAADARREIERLEEVAAVRRRAIEDDLRAKSGEFRAMAGRIEEAAGRLAAIEARIVERRRAVSGEVRAAEDDLRAKRGELGAIEDQIRATLGRLRATDTDLRAKTDDLRAAEERIRATAGRAEAVRRAADAYAARVRDIALSLPPSALAVWPEALAAARDLGAAGEPVKAYQLRKRLGLTSGSTADRLVEALAQLGFATSVQASGAPVLNGANR